MSKRRDIESQLRSLTEIKEIMSAMKNLALMEVHRLTRFLDTQHRVVATIEAAAADFLFFHLGDFPEKSRNIHLLLGTERGFCGDFNESLVRALDNHSGSATKTALVIIGSKLAAKLEGDTRITASLVGASVVEEVDSVLINLMERLTGLNAGQRRVPCASRYSIANPKKVVEGHRFAPFQGPRVERKPFWSSAPTLPEAAKFLSALAEQYLFAELHELLYRSLMAENQRRMQHMDAAVRRLERTSAELLRRCNTLRQEEITEEIEVIMLSVKALE